MAQDQGGIDAATGGVADPDELLGEAVEAYLARAESGQAPEPEEFAESYPESLREDLVEALVGLSLVRGLVGAPPGSGGGPAGRRLRAGRRLAGYRIVGELGSGGMGVVYEAVHVDLDRPVALKVLDARAMRPGSKGLQRFLNEAKTAAALHHTHIVPVFDVGHVGGLCYYAMQRIEGSGLDRVIKALRRDRSLAAGSGSQKSRSRSRMPWRRSLSSWSRSVVRAEPSQEISTPSQTPLWDGSAVSGLHSGDEVEHHTRRDDDDPPPYEPPRGTAYYRWVAEVGREAAEALAYAHHRGIIHRDVKPSNLLIDARGSIWVADFGLARRLAEPGLTQAESLVGTPRYMSPEQTRTGPLDGRTDVYSLGATLYELLTLRPPFEGRTTAELLEQIGKRDPIAPRRHDGRIPRDLETIVLKALSPRPGDRYAGAQELADDLGRFLRVEPVRARRIGPVGRAWRLARRHPAITAVSTVSAAAVLSTATVAYLRVVQARDRAVSAESSMQDVLRDNLISQAALMRISPVPDRRAKGLDLLRQAAGRKPTAIQRPRLQSEAIAYLSLRDVERRADAPIDSRSGLAFVGAGAHLLGVSEDHERVLGWQPPAAPAESSDGTVSSVPAGPETASPSGPPAPGWDPARWVRLRRIAAMSRQTAVIWPDGKGIRLFQGNPTAPNATFTDLASPDREFVSIHPVETSAGPRLVTIERLAVADRPGAGGPGVPGRGDRERGQGLVRGGGGGGPGGGGGGGGGRGRQPQFQYRANLWDLSRAWSEGPIASLAEPSVPASDTAQPEIRTIPLVATHPDGPRIAVAWWLGSTVESFSATDGQKLGPALETRSSISALALASHGQLATAASGVVRLWDPDSQAQLTNLTPQQGFILRLDYNPDGTLLAVSGPGNDVEVWDPAAAQLVAALPTSERVEGVAFDTAGQWLAIGQAATVQMWAVVEPDVQQRSTGLPGPAASLTFLKDGSLAIPVWGNNEPAHRWVPKPFPAIVPAVESYHLGPIAHDGQGHLVTIGSERHDPTVGRPGTFTADRLLWFQAEDRSGRPIRSFELDRGGGGGGGVGGGLGGGPGRGGWILSTAADGRTIAALSRVGSNHRQFLWHADQPDRLLEILPPAGYDSARNNDRDRDRDRFGRGGPEGGPPPDGGGPGRPVGGDRRREGGPPLEGPPPGEPGGLDGPRRTGAGRDGEPQGPDVAMWLPLGLGPQGDTLFVLRLEPRAKTRQLVVWTLATDLDGRFVRASEVRRTELPFPIAGSGATIVSPDGALLAEIRQGRRIAIIDAATGRDRGLLPQPPDAAEFTSIQLAPDRRSLAAGDRDGVVCVWSLDANGVATGSPLALPGHRGIITALAFDSDGRKLATAGEDKTLVVWDLARLHQELAALCPSAP
jgi:serine/threonine protein kinase/WD40 repeat protein